MRLTRLQWPMLALLVLTVALPIVTNLATNQLPNWLKSYTWHWWLLLGVLIVLYIVLSLCQPSQEASTQHSNIDKHLSMREPQHTVAEKIKAISGVLMIILGLLVPLEAMPGRLAPGESQWIHDPSVPPTVISPDPWQLRTLAKALQSVPGKVEEVEAQQIFGKLVAVIENTADPWALGALTEALRAVPGEFAPEKARQVSARLFTIIEQTTHPEPLGVLMQALLTVSGALISRGCSGDIYPPFHHHYALSP